MSILGSLLFQQLWVIKYKSISYWWTIFIHFLLCVPHWGGHLRIQREVISYSLSAPKHHIDTKVNFLCHSETFPERQNHLNNWRKYLWPLMSSFSHFNPIALSNTMYVCLLLPIVLKSIWVTNMSFLYCKAN